MDKMRARYMNPLTLDDDSSCSVVPQRHYSMRQSRLSPGDIKGHGIHTAVPTSDSSMVSHPTELDEGRLMTGCSLQSRTSGFRGTARGAQPSGGDDDPPDINTSSASSSTTSPQWRRHNPYRALSSTTSTPTESPRVGDSGVLLLPGGLSGANSSGSALPPQHVSVVLHPRSSRGAAVSLPRGEMAYRPQQSAMHVAEHLQHTAVVPKMFPPDQQLSRTSSAASRASSHYSCGHCLPSNTNFLPDVDVVEGSTSSSGVFLMHNYQFRMNSYRHSGAASSYATTPHSYATADQYFDEMGVFAVDDDDDTGAPTSCDIRRRFAASRSSPDEADPHQRHSDVDGRFCSGGMTALLVAPTHGRTVSGLVSNARVSSTENGACGPNAGLTQGIPHTTGDDTNSEQEWGPPPQLQSPQQRARRPTKAPSNASSTTTATAEAVAVNQNQHQTSSRVVAYNDGDQPIMSPHADPSSMSLESSGVMHSSHINLSPSCESQGSRRRSTALAAAPSAAGPISTMGFTVAQLTDLLETHFARTLHRSGGGGGEGAGAEGIDEIWCPAGSQFSVYDSGMRQHYLINSEQVAVTRGAIKYVALNERYGNQTRFRFQLCNRYLRHHCTSGSECQYIHSVVVSTVTQVHMNENSITNSGVRQMNPEELAGGRNTLDYPTIAPGMIFAVYPPNQLNSSPQLILSEHILRTEGALQTYQAILGSATAAGGGGGGGHTQGNESPIVRPRHCAHFQFKRMCNLGNCCHFIHSLIPFVQGMLNQPPLPPTVDLSNLKTNAHGFMYRPIGIDGAIINDNRNRNRWVGTMSGRPHVGEVHVPPSVCSEGAQQVWSSAAVPSEETNACLGINNFYGSESNAAQRSSWLVPQKANGATVYGAQVPSYPVMLPMGSVEAVTPPASIERPLNGKRHGVPLGPSERANAMKRFPFNQKQHPYPQHLFLGIPSVASQQRRDSRTLPPSQPHRHQRWSSESPLPIFETAMSLQTRSSAFFVPRESI